jgi:hypothetical protein
MTDPKPQPCPVCKSEDTGTMDGDHWTGLADAWVGVCYDCGVSGPVRPYEDDAIRAWNRLRYVEET